MKLIQTKDYLLLIDEEAEININDYWIYLTSNEDFDGVVTRSNLTEKDWYSKLHDRFAYKKVTAYYPLNSEAKELDLPLLPPFEVDVEELSEKANGYAYYGKPLGEKYLAFKEGFIEGYKAAQSKQFSLDDMEIAFHKGRLYQGREGDTTFESFIQSLSTKQLPKEFIMKKEPIYEERYVSEMSAYMPYCIGEKPWIITNSEGKQELVGIYKY